MDANSLMPQNTNMYFENVTSTNQLYGGMLSPSVASSASSARFASFCISADEHLISTWNDSAHSLLGHHTDEILGSNISRLMHPSTNGMLLGMLCDLAIQTGIGSQSDVFISKRDGSYVSAELLVIHHPAIFGGKNMFTIVISTSSPKSNERLKADAHLKKLTPQEDDSKKQQDVTRASKERDLTNYLCHELRNQCQGILSCVELAAVSVDEAKQQLQRKESRHQARQSHSQSKSDRSLNSLNDKLDEIKELLETMSKCLNHQRKIVDDTLNVSKSESGDLLLELTSFQPLAVVDSATRMYRGSIDQNRLQLKVESTPDCPNEVFNDAGRLREVIINLLSNAIKWTKEGFIKIKLSKVHNPSNSNLLQISVEDTGEGMSEQELSKLFQRFSGSKCSETQNPGSGLGLLITKNLITHMGGTIAVTSEKNKGSIFTFTICTDMRTMRKRSESSMSLAMTTSAGGAPSLKRRRTLEAKEATNTQDIASEAVSTEKNVSAAHQPHSNDNPMRLKGKLLVVDNSELSRRLLQQLLTKIGCQTEIASNGPEALQTFDQESYDAIILDLLMPAVTGVEAMQVIREREIVLRRALRTPIVVLSEDYFEEHERRKLIEAGADAVISKVSFDFLFPHHRPSDGSHIRPETTVEISSSLPHFV